MQKEKLLTPDYLFEVSWEVCNKVGGIHTVIATKIASIEKSINKPHILIGPDIIQGNETNQEFIEDDILLRSWKLKAQEQGLKIRIGRWNIAKNPIVILIDFTPFFSQKDAIFTELWDNFKLDSLSGQWDYIEPALFGYASGKVIESYVKFHCTASDKIIAQFHEWMTGTGLLYLKSSTPQVATAFTTHATVLGRCIAGNNLPLYDNLNSYNPDTIAQKFNVTAKQSLEKIAAQEADTFTTVSDITSKECKQFLCKDVDIVTPNGFQDFIAGDKDFEEKTVTNGRNKLIKVAEAILNRPIDDNALLIGTSGRYEYKNKGIDVFIETLARLNKRDDFNREIIGFILVPAGHHGPSRDLIYNLSHPNEAKPLQNPYLTHELNNIQYDPVINQIKNSGLNNTNNDKVKIFFVPSYLNGNDGVFDVPYYDLLTGLDLTLFPSYYEPWGYTPLESVAFKVPTITTSLAGFGLWVKTHYKEDRPGIAVINRTDDNDKEVISRMEEHIVRHASYDKVERKSVKENAYEISKIALWDNLISYYLTAYSGALEKVPSRYNESDFISDTQIKYTPDMPQSLKPNWVNIIVHRDVPTRLKGLEELAYNLWWCWNQDAKDLFESVDPELWKKLDFNPIVLLDSLSYQRYQKLENNAEFLSKLDAVYGRFKTYMSEKNTEDGPSISYFCMEYGLHSSLKIYSGGLGILAGDYLKEASDKNVRMTGVGLLYKYGYFTQRLSTNGEQENIYEYQHFDKIPVKPVRDENNRWVTVEIILPGRNMHAKVWKVDVGRVELFLLDTDIEDNLPEDRSVTHHLYGGDWENRLKQELLLGIGGIRVLEKINRPSDVYHCNEGHAALTGMERIHLLMESKHLSFNEAKEVIRSSSLFTTHTPVPAGHDAFDEGLLRKYISHYPDRFNVSWDTIMGLGRMHPNNHDEKFSMSVLAVNLSQEVNGVSWLHGKVSQKMFKDMFPGYHEDESYIGYVTNGVHYPTWAAPEWKVLYEKVFGADFAKHHYDKSCFSNIQKVDSQQIWDIRRTLKVRMLEHIKERLTNNNQLFYYTPREIVSIIETLDPDKLTFGFARRFATYKRAQLLFKDLNTLNDIVNHPTKPAQFIFAGKAHPADKAGQDLIKKIVEISKYPQFLGKILFIENYDMELASNLVQGVDIWLNTPTRPMEASGTSGEKAVMNGVMHFSVLDGWWVEGYQKDAGWALPLEQVYENNDYQNELDAEIIYNTIENEIAPLYYKREDGIPNEWIQYVKNSIDKVASNFTMNRQLTDYEDRFYNKLEKRYHEIKKDNYQMAKSIVAWKEKIARDWASIEIISVNVPSIYKESITLGKSYDFDLTLNCGSLSASDDIEVEIVAISSSSDMKTEKIIKKKSLDFVSQKGSIATYQLKYTTSEIGNFNVGLRIYAKNPLLAHQQDSGFVKWM